MAERSAATLDQIMEQARKSMQAGDVALARQLLDYVVRADPGNSVATHMLASLPDGAGTQRSAGLAEPSYDYAYQLAQDAAVMESLRLGLPPPGPASERLRRWNIARIWLTVALVVLIPIAGRACWGDFAATLRQQKIDAAQFERSPGCSSTATDVDTTLPPCTLVPATIVDKSTRTRPSKAYGQYTVYSLRVRELTGAIHDYHEVSERFWGDVTVGEAVAIKQWRGQQVELDAGAESIDVVTFQGEEGGLFHRAVAWLIVVFVSLAVLQLMWWRRRRFSFRWF